jgi:ElaB/YqjD/DUF883 family membrane-anchored ribosome-binding protein
VAARPAGRRPRGGRRRRVDQDQGRDRRPRLLEDVNRILGRAENLQGQAGQRARQLTEAERKQIADAVKDARIELWTGAEDKILRRLNVQLKFEVPEASREKAQGLSSGTIRFDLALGAINDEQKFTAPENAQPFEDFVAALNGGSGGASQPAPQSGGSTYDECVAQAGTDISKLQACAE